MILIQKRGDYKWDVLIIILLGLMVLAIVLYFIFSEYFDEDAINMETCRQSIVLRNTLPEQSLAGLNKVSFKDKFPLKCKTQVINIDYEDVERAEKEVAETLVGCWFLFGSGNYNIFPSYDWSTWTSCVVCARVHVNAKKQKFYSGENEINIDRALSREFKDGKSYLEYIKSVGEEDPFKLINIKKKQTEFSMTEEKVSGYVPGYEEHKIMSVRFDVPGIFDPKKGDLIVVYQNLVLRGVDVNMANLIFFHSGNNGIDILNKDQGKVFQGEIGSFLWPDKTADKMCHDWDGIIV